MERELENLECEISEALEKMVKHSCPDMLPLWLEGTKKLRKKYFQAPAPEFPVHLRNRSPSFCSKYKCLARWRHGVIWRRDRLDEDIDSEKVDESAQLSKEREAMDAIYFTRCENRPPYSYSQKKSESPRLKQSSYSEEEVLERSVLAILAELKEMDKKLQQMEGGPEAHFLWEAIGYKTLNDILKLKDYDESVGGDGEFIWEPPSRPGKQEIP